MPISDSGFLPRSSQRVVNPQAGKSGKTGVMSPDLDRSVIEGGQTDLKIEDARPANLELPRELDEPLPEAFPGGPEHRPRLHNQRAQESGRLPRRRSASAALGMRNDAPEFADAGQGASPSARVAARLLDRAPCRQVLRQGSPMRVN